MAKLLTDHLHAICRSVLEAVMEAVPGEILACDLVQVDRREFRFQSVAAAHFPGGPVRRLLLGCEERLASHLAGALDGGADGTTSGGEGGPDAAVAQGLDALCRRIQFQLADSGLPWAGDQDFLVHDHNQFRVVCDGARNFLFRLAVAEGRLDLVVDLAPRLLGCDWLTQAMAGGQVTVGGGEESITEPSIVRRILDHLAESGADVEVKIPAEGDRLELLQATFLARRYDPDGERLSLTCARRTSLEDAADVPDKVDLVFILQDKLLQCTCPVVSHDHVWLDDDIALPTLELGHPAAVTYGQRRGAFRLEPPERVHGTVCRDHGERAAGQRESSSLLDRSQICQAPRAIVAKPVPMRVLDLSYTGVKILLGNNAIISGFKGGSAVTVTMELPEKFGQVALPAIVRRVHVNPEEPGSRGTTLGLEFAASEDDAGLARVRRYIQDRHHARLAAGGAELEIG
jgi:c-di-GMP-binding flagellar brake protein YcgR